VPKVRAYFASVVSVPATNLATPEAGVAEVVVVAEVLASDESDGLRVIAYEYVITSDAVAPTVVTEKVELATAPTATEAVGFVIVVVPTVAAFAGTTDKSPNPSEATATTATFFNEIVFTIFLSFSQIKDDLLSGWQERDTH
jgi:hypothetical protein